MRFSKAGTWGTSLLLAAGVAAGTWIGSTFHAGPVARAQSSATVPAQARSQFAQAKDDFYSDDSPIIHVVEKVKDAVVNIEAESDRDRSGGDDERSWFPFFHPPIGRTESFGSGFFIRGDGTILTNAHVVSDADRVRVRLSDEHEFQAKIVGIDPETDLAVLRIDAGAPVPFIELGDSDHLRIGQWVVAIGNPFPQQKLDRTVTVGVVSGIGRSALNFGQETPTYQNYIQTDAAINPGNSGGPLVDLHGRAVGVNAAIASPSGGNVGIGFAIPVTYVRAILDDLLADGRVSRGYLGIGPGELTPDIAESLDLTGQKGIVVQTVQKGTAADRYGVKQGDVIVRFNGESVVDVQQFMFLVAQTKPQTSVDIDVIREGKPRSLTVTLGNREDLRQTQATGRVPDDESPDSWFGMSVQTATRDLADRYSVPFEPGVIVTEVEPGSAAEAKNIARGDIITSIQRQKVTGLSDFRSIKAELQDWTRPVLFLVSGSNGQPRFVALKNR
jgi:serine protease Do